MKPQDKKTCRFPMRKPLNSLLRHGVFATLWILAVGPAFARANFGSVNGGWNSEPTGLENIRITRETLTIDLRGCDGSETVIHEGPRPVGRLEAIYQLYNSGTERRVTLLFAAGLAVESDAIEVFLNNSPVKSTSTSAHKSDWKLPDTTPGIDGAEARHFYGGYETPVDYRLAVTIPQGSSTLRVGLRTMIGNNRDRLVTCCWQFIYLLAPARDWGGFERLDVSVFLPAGWRAASNVELQRDGDVLHGAFDGIPRDAIELTIQMPPEPFIEHIRLLGILTWIGIGVFVPSMLLMTWRFGVRVQSRIGKGPLVLAAALVWGAAAWISAWFLLFEPIELPSVPLLQRGSYGWAIPIIDIVFFFGVVGTLIGGALSYVQIEAQSP